MMSRKRIPIILTLAVVFLVASVSACKKDNQASVCKHEWSGYVVTISAACTESGAETRTCSFCGEKETIVIEPLGHDEVTDKADTATCTKNGKTEGKHCLRCGIVFSESEVLPAIGHDFSDFIIDVNPTCIEKGRKYRKCARCGEKSEYTDIEPVGHSYSDYVYNDDATCTADGTKSARCLACGKTDTLTAEETALGHDTVIDAGYAATCVENGLTDGMHCHRCGEILVNGKTIPALGHNGIVIPEKEPSCTESGLTEGKKCVRCNKILIEQRVVSALGHVIYKLAAVKPTCTVSGLTEGEKCSRCEQIITPQKEIPALGHDYKENTVPFTCTQDGYTLHRCSRCTAEYKSDIVAAHHVWNMENATCGADKACLACGKVAEKATGNHAFKDGVCSVCSYRCTHDYNIEYKEATCTEKGYEIKLCKICDVIKTTETSEALGHDGNVVCGRCKTRIIPETFFVDTLLFLIEGGYKAQIEGKLADEENSPLITLRKWHYDNGNEFIELELTVPHESFSENAVIRVKNESGKIYASCKATVVTDAVNTEEWRTITVKNEQYKVMSSLEEIVNNSVIPQKIRPIVKKLLNFGTDERAFIAALAQKYPYRTEKIGEYLADNMFFVRKTDRVALDMDQKADAFSQKVLSLTLEQLYNDIFGSGELDATIARLKKSDDQTDIRYLAFLQNNRAKTVCETISSDFGGVISVNAIENTLSDFLDYGNGASSRLYVDYVEGKPGKVLFDAGMSEGKTGSVLLSNYEGSEEEITLPSAVDEIKTHELSSERQKELFRSHTLSYNTEQSRFELNSTFNIVSRIAVDEKTGKSYVISLEKNLSAFTKDAVPAVEAWKKDCSGYEAHIYSFDFYGTESVSAAAYELKDNKIGAKINLTSVWQARILAALSDYTDSESYEKQISLRREVRLMKNVDTGAFTIIPEDVEVSSVTHHKYILKKSANGYGCGAETERVFVCSVCGDEYTVYKTVAHNQNYEVSFEFTGNEKDCESGVVIKYSCPDCKTEVKRVQTTDHVPFVKYESFSEYGLCADHSIESLSCPCGKESYLSLKDKKGENYEQPEFKYVKTEKSGSLFVCVGAFKCPECGMLAEICDTTSGKANTPLSRTITIGKGKLIGSTIVFDRVFRSVKANF